MHQASLNNFMTTNLKRLTISLPDDIAEAVTTLAKVQGTPQTKVIIDVLREFTPTIIATAKIYKQIKAGEKDAAKQTIQHLLGDAMASLLEPEINSKIDRKK